jgi:glycosyltransferase involved in cell wall biosynthesis
MISIVMPAHNESGYLAEAVKATVAGLTDRGVHFEIIVSENGSADSTREEAAALEHAFTNSRVITSPTADYGRALRRGFEAAAGDVVVNFDVDMVDLDFLDKAVEKITAEGADVVVGTKRGPGAHDQRGVARKLVTAVFSGILKYGFGLKISDTHGLKALRRATVAGIVDQCRFTQDIYDTEMVIRAERAGLDVREIPVTVAERRPPRTSIVARIPRSLLGLARLRVDLWRHPPTLHPPTLPPAGC